MINNKMGLSVIVPAYNESLYIETCLHSIKTECNKLDINLELIVIDNGSTDNTPILAKKFTEHVFSIPRNSVSYARNFGVYKSTNTILAFIDGDVEVTSRWAQYVFENLNAFNENLLFLSGYQCVVPQNGSWIELHWFSNLKDQLLGGANIVTSRKAFDTINGFDESLKTGEDYDYCIRSINSGINYSPNRALEAIHLGFPHTLRDFIKREYWHGEGDFKSFSRFSHSPVAIIAVVFLIVQIVAIGSLLNQRFDIFIVMIAIIFSLNLLITLKRFSQCRLKTIAINSFLNYAYFCARIGSLYRALCNRKKNF